mmetsp:Transcript_42789/g.56515  ORF Transcript_42789/g.56515 Transcript_42789/m.56515 type:complete len:129 (+) Transcript_42789:98-484(+)
MESFKNHRGLPAEITLGASDENQALQPASMLTSSRIYEDSYRNPKPTVAHKLHQLFTFLAKKEAQIETVRARLAKMGDFEPRQAFERVARDRNRLEARDIFYYIDRFSEHETHTIEACHFVVRYWNQS